MAERAHLCVKVTELMRESVDFSARHRKADKRRVEAHDACVLDQASAEKNECPSISAGLSM